MHMIHNEALYVHRYPKNYTLTALLKPALLVQQAAEQRGGHPESGNVHDHAVDQRHDTGLRHGSVSTVRRKQEHDAERSHNAGKVVEEEIEADEVLGRNACASKEDNNVSN